MNSRKRILVFSAGIYKKPVGGGRMIIKVLQVFKELGHEVCFVGFKETAIHSFLKNKNIKNIRLIENKKMNKLKKILLLRKALMKTIKEEQVDIIWIPNIMHFLILLPNIVFFNSIKVVVNHWLIHKNLIAKIAYNLEPFFSNALVFEYEKQETDIYSFLLYKKVKSKSFTVETPIEIRKSNNISEKKKKITIGTLSSIVPRKNLHTLLKALCNYKINVEIELKIAGEIPNEKYKTYLEKLRRIIHCCKLENIVDFEGWQNSAKFLSNIDIFVIPSYSEGLSGALREAAVNGLPIIASNIGGNKMIVKPEKNGELFNPFKSKELSIKLTKVINSYTNYKFNAELLSNKYQKQFSYENFKEKYRRVIEFLD